MSRWAPIFEADEKLLEKMKEKGTGVSPGGNKFVDEELKRNSNTRWNEPSLPKQNEKFGGPVWNSSVGGGYNACFRYSERESSFIIPPKAKLFEEVLLCRKYFGFFNEIQKAVGRIAVYKSPDSAVLGSGVFISPTVFITRGHCLESDEEVAAALSLTHKITWEADATLFTLEGTPQIWRSAKLLEISLYEDFAVYGLTSDRAEKWIPIEDIYTGPLDVGDIVAGIVYNGNVDRKILKTYLKDLSEHEKPPISLTVQVADVYFHPGFKSIGPGKIAMIGVPGVPNMDHMLGVTFTCCSGSSGGPIFLIREGAPPVLIGSVLGARNYRNFNRATTFYPEVLELAGKALKDVGEQK